MSWALMKQTMLGTCLSTFGEAVLHQTPDGQAFARNGIYSDTFETIDGDGYKIISQLPNLGVRLSDWLPEPRQEDRIIRDGGIVYWVRHVEKDGEGGATIMLDKRTGISGHSPVQFEPGNYSGVFK